MKPRQILFTIFFIFSLLAVPAISQAALGTVTPFSGTSPVDLMATIRFVVNALLTFVAVIAVIFVIIGGLRYIVSQGDDDAAVKAKNTIIYAIIGLIIIILSAAIVNFIITSIQNP